MTKNCFCMTLASDAIVSDGMGGCGVQVKIIAFDYYVTKIVIEIFLTMCSGLSKVMIKA